jgi:SNF2 family DNA or RNA helicase
LFLFENPDLRHFLLDLYRWQKLIQKPYENGDDRGLKIVRAILRPLMLRRTKETKDKIGKYVFSPNFQSSQLHK